MHSSLRTIDHMMGISDNMMLGCGFTSYKNIFNMKHHLPKDKSHTLEEIAKLTGYKKKGLQTIFNKGVGAYYTNPLSVRKQVKSPEQWAMGRVYASINPTSKAYKVDKNHLKRGGMIGGMAKYNAEGDIVERLERRDNPEDEIQAETLEITEYIDEINDADNLSDKQKFNEIMKQVGDLKELYKDSEITETGKELIKSKLGHINNVLSEDKYDKFNPKDYKYEKVKGNPLYEKFYEEANYDPTERGNISEEQIMKYDIDTGILEDYDGDKSRAFDSKNILAYDPEYIKFLSGNRFDNNWNYQNLPIDKRTKLRDHLRNEFLQYYPIDTIKNDTLWELKSYKSPTKNNKTQDLQQTKIEGQNQYELRYKQNNKGEWVVDNIYDKVIKKNTLPERQNGYKYFWGFNNVDGIAEANPLKSSNFIPIPITSKKTGDILYYKGDWKNKITKYGKPYLQINNSELKKEPSRYSKKYNKRITI
jgi:hypothetical protein